VDKNWPASNFLLWSNHGFLIFLGSFFGKGFEEDLIKLILTNDYHH
jgi:hypothetical protein